MTTPSNVVTFFAEAHWGSRWGVIDAFHPTPHKGLDLGLFRGNVDVPALYGGRVVAVGPSSSVGHYVTVQRGGLFDTYCHIVPGVSVGQTVAQGARLGRQAITQAEGGTAWRGQHTHLCLSNTLTGWAYWDKGVHNLDPTPGVIAALTNAAGGGSALLENEDTMIHWGRNDAGKVTYALGDAEHWEEYTDGARQAADAALYGVYEDITNNNAKKNAWNYRSNTRPDLKKPFGVQAVGSATDLSGVTKQLTDIDTKVSAIHVPTKGTVELA